MPPRAATLPLLLISGEWEEARNLAEITRSEGSPLERQMAATILGRLHRYQGDPDAAWEMVREILPRGPASEPEDALFPYATETLRLATRLSLDAGDGERAQEWLNTHNAWLDWSGAARGRAEAAALRSAIHALSGNLQNAEQCAREALALASEPRQPLALIDAELALGRTLVQCGNPSKAREHFLQAVDLARACAAPHEQALSEIELASLDRTQSRDKADIDTLLTCARARAASIQATPLLERIDLLMAESVHHNTLGLLTEREIEVLRAIAEGMTDAEAAGQLFISPRTVSQHMRSVYNKLGVSSRAAATRWAVEHDLV